MYQIILHCNYFDRAQENGFNINEHDLIAGEKKSEKI